MGIEYRTFDSEVAKEVHDVLCVDVVGEVGDVGDEGRVPRHPVLVVALLPCLPRGRGKGHRLRHLAIVAQPGPRVVVIVVNLPIQNGSLGLSSGVSWRSQIALCIYIPNILSNPSLHGDSEKRAQTAFRTQS